MALIRSNFDYILTFVSFISEDTLKLIEERREMKVKGFSQDTALYKAKSREIKRSVRKDKKQFIEDKCKEMEDHNSKHEDRQLYQKVNELTKEFRPSLKVIKDKNGQVLTENNQILGRWREYCSQMYSAPQNSEVSDVENEIEEELEPEPLLDEIRWALNNINDGKSPGCDDVPIELIKEGKENSILLYHKIVLKIWKTCTWPISWKRSIYIPLPKKGDLKLCSNHRTIALISHASKILLKIIQKRLERKLDDEINIVQAGFRPNRGTRDHIFNIRNILEKCREFNKDLYACFIDYSKAFDCVEHQKMWKIMAQMGFPKHLIRLIESLYQNQEAAVRVDGETSEWFNVGKGVRQGCILSPYLFNVYAENIMRNFRDDAHRFDDVEDPEFDTYESISIGGRSLPELRYADDTVLLSSTPEGLEKMIRSVKQHSEDQNLYLNAKKTKIMKTDKTERATNIVIDGETIEEVIDFDYLGSLITQSGDGIKEIRRRLGMASRKLGSLKKVWKGNDDKTKLKFLRSLIFPIATYGSETWSISKEAEKKINAFEFKCYRKILRIPWTAKRTNASILNHFGNIPEHWLQNTIVRQKMKFFGHIKRHQSLEKQIYEGIVPGKRGRGRPKRRWSQDITDRLQTTVAEAGRRAQDRDAYRRAVINATSRGAYAT